VISYRHSLAQDRNPLGVFYVSWGRLDDAEREHRRAVSLREGLVREHPDRVDFAVDLGGSYCNLATLLKEQGRYDASRRRYDRAVEVLNEAARRSSEHDPTRRFLFNAYWGRATRAYQRGEYPRSLAEWERARGVVGGRLEPGARVVRAVTFARLGDPARAVAEARSAADSRQGMDVYTAARVYAVAAEVAQPRPGGLPSRPDPRGCRNDGNSTL
jgi:tetratricopeptide (TPR) repeat protein